MAAALRAAPPEWEALGVKDRTKYSEKLRDLLLDNQNRIADLMQAETGKVRAEAVIELSFTEPERQGAQKPTKSAILARTQSRRVEMRDGLTVQDMQSG